MGTVASYHTLSAYKTRKLAGRSVYLLTAYLVPKFLNGISQQWTKLTQNRRFHKLRASHDGMGA